MKVTTVNIALVAALAAALAAPAVHAQGKSGENGNGASASAGSSMGGDQGKGAEKSAKADDKGQNKGQNNGQGKMLGKSGEMPNGTKMAGQGMAKGKNQLTYGSLISGLRNGKSVDLGALPADTVISFVTLTQLNGNGAENASALDKALDAEAARISAIRADIDANTQLTAALTAQGLDSADVVGVSTQDDGQVILVIDDLS